MQINKHRKHKVDCINFKKTVLSDPNNLGAELRAHHKDCNQCAIYLDEIKRTDALLKSEALAQVPLDLAAKIKNSVAKTTPVETSPKNIRSYAIAASLALVLVFGAAQFINGYFDTRVATQFREAAAQYIHEQPQLLEIRENVSREKLDRLVKAFGGQLIGEIEGVRFAEACGLEPVPAAHLILDGDYGPVSVMYSSDSVISKKLRFEMYDMNAIHYPAKKGSIAIFGGTDESLDKVMNKIGAAISW